MKNHDRRYRKNRSPGEILAVLVLLVGASWVVFAGELGLGFEIGAGNNPAVASSGMTDEIHVVWETPAGGLTGQTFDASGDDLDDPVTVTGNALDKRPDVAQLSDDDLIIAWERQTAQPAVIVSRFGQERGVQLHFSKFGQERGVQYQVDAAILPAVAAAGEGRYVVAWTAVPNGQHYAQGFFADDTPTDRIAVGQAGAKTPADLAALPDGVAFIVWESPSKDIHGGLVDAFGQERGVQFSKFGQERGVQLEIGPINTSPAGDHRAPAVAVDLSENFTVVWERVDGNGQSQILGRRFDAFGQERGVQFTISEPARLQSATSSAEPQIAADSIGNVITIWRHGSTVMARPLNIDGPPTSLAFRVDMGDVVPGRARITPTTGGTDFIVIWEGLNQGGLQARQIVGPFLTQTQ